MPSKDMSAGDWRLALGPDLAWIEALSKMQRHKSRKAQTNGDNP